MQLPFCLFVAAQPCFFITGSAFPMFQVLLRLGLVVVSIVFSIEVIDLRLSVSHVYGISFVVGSLFFCPCHSSGSSSSSSGSSTSSSERSSIDSSNSSCSGSSSSSSISSTSSSTHG